MAYTMTKKHGINLLLAISAIALSSCFEGSGFNNVPYWCQFAGGSQTTLVKVYTGATVVCKSATDMGGTSYAAYSSSCNQTDGSTSAPDGCDCSCPDLMTFKGNKIPASSSTNIPVPPSGVGPNDPPPTGTPARPSTPLELIASVMGSTVTFSWKPSKRDESKSDEFSASHSADDYQVVISSGPITIQGFEDAITNGVPGKDYFRYSRTKNYGQGLNGEVEEATITLDPGHYYARVRAINQFNPNDINSNMSSEVDFSTTVTPQVQFYPPITNFDPSYHMNIPYAKVVFDASVPLNAIANISLQFHDSYHLGVVWNVAVERDKLDDRTFYFTPPDQIYLPAAVKIRNFNGGDLDMGSDWCGSPNLNQSNPHQAIQSVVDGLKIKIEQEISNAKYQKNLGSIDGATAVQQVWHSIERSVPAQISTELLDFITHPTPYMGWWDKTKTDAFLGSLNDEIGISLARLSDYLFKGFEELGGPLISSPLAKVSSTAAWGNSDFFTTVDAYFDAHPTVYYYYGESSPIQWMVLRAEKYSIKMQEYPNTSDVGKIIDDAVLDNPQARIVLNGAMFNYKFLEPRHVIGDVYNNCAPGPTSTVLGRGLASMRWIWGELATGSFVYPSKGNIQGPTHGCSQSDFKNGTGGLYIYVTGGVDRVNLGRSGPHVVSAAEDMDLSKLQSSLGKGFAGYGGIAHWFNPKNQHELLLVFAKPQPFEPDLGKAYPYLAYQKSLESTQQDLVAMGVDNAVGVDGGGSLAMAVKIDNTQKILAKSWLHTIANRGENQLVPSYIVFQER